MQNDTNVLSLDVIFVGIHSKNDTKLIMFDNNPELVNNNNCFSNLSFS